MSALEDAVAECRAKGLTMSQCLELLDRVNACGDRLPSADTADASSPAALVAVAPKNDRGFGGGPIVYSCDSVPNPQKAAVLLKEALAVVEANKPGPPWWLIGGGVAALGVAIYFATR